MSRSAASTTVLPPIATERATGASPAFWRWGRRLVILAMLAGAGIALRLTYFRPEPVPVSVVRVETGLVEEMVTNNKAGTVSARRRASVGPEIGGRVTRLPVEEGAHVTRGDILLTLSDTDFRAQLELQERSLEAARASVTEACAAADLAARNLERTRQLAADQLVSRQALDQAESQQVTSAAACTAARARMRQGEASLTVARLNLTKTMLYAPFDGVVSKVAVELGEWMAPAPAGALTSPVIELIDTTSIYVRAPLDEVDAGRVRVGAPVRITMDAFPGRSFPGHVTYVGAYVSEAQQQNRTFDIDAEFADAALARTLLPGTSADVEIVLQARDGVVRVPTSAILQGARVLVVRDDTLVSVPVRIGLANWEYTEVVDGVKTGDRVVVSLDRLEVREGAKVRVEQGAAK